MAKTKFPNNERESEVLERLRQRVDDWYNYYSQNNDNYRKDIKFVYGEDGQWSNEEIKEYDDEHKPRLTFNMMPRYISNLQGEFSENVPDLKVLSQDATEVDDQLQQRINLLSGLLRNISLSSRNDIVYEAAFNSAVAGGYGCFRIRVEPEDVMSFNQIIRYQIIEDATTAFWDPNAKEPNKEDGSCCGTCVLMSKKEFKEKYPEAEVPEDFDAFRGAVQWVTKDAVCVVDYYEKVGFKRHIALLSNGMVVNFEDAPKMVRDLNKRSKLLIEMGASQGMPEKVEIMQDEVRDDFFIQCYRATRNQILESSKWDGEFMPIVYQPGVKQMIENKEKTISFVHWSKDAQRTYNYTRSEFMYRLKLLRYEKFTASLKNIEGNEELWRNVHRAKAVLPFKPDVNNPQGPRQLGATEVSQSYIIAMQQSMTDMENIPGRFEANMGATSNEQSGVAVANRQKAGNLTAKPYFDNAITAIETGARITMDLVQKIFDTKRSVATRSADGEEKVVEINSSEDSANNITKGKFSVAINVGSSFAVQKSEAVAQLLSTYQVSPKLAEISPDILAANLDIKDSSTLAQRARNYLIPQITTNEVQNLGTDQILQQAQQAQQAQQQQAQQQMQLQQQLAQMEMMAQQQFVQDDKIKAMAAQMGALAKLMDSQSKREEVKLKGMDTQVRANAELQKAEMETQQEIIRTVGELAKEG